MAEGYATVAARGMHCDSTPVLSITDRSGEPLPLTPTTCNRVLKKAQADAISDILRGVIEGGFAHDQYLGSGYDSAGKTGTIDDEKTVWFVGYTPHLAAAAMVDGVNKKGHWVTLNGQYVHDTYITEACGSCNAAPMWGEAMKGLVADGWMPPGSCRAPNPEVVNGQQADIPSVYGYDPDTATNILTKLGFNVLIADSTVPSTAPYGTVAYSSPSGTGYSREVVTLYLSNGQPPPPPPPANNGGGGGGGQGGGDQGGGNPGGGNP